MSFVSQNECEWNRKLIQNYAKMIRLLLVLLGVWTIFTLAWIVHLIVLKSSHGAPEAWHILNKRSDESRDLSLRSYEDLEFYTFVNGTTDWDRIKMIIGGFHRLKESQGKVPKITFYTSEPLELMKKGESSAWNKVEFKHSNMFHNNNMKQEIWFSSNYSFNPVALELRKAELLDESNEFKKAFKKGRDVIESLSNGCFDLVDELTGEIVLKSFCEERTIKRAKEFGLKRISNVNRSQSCYVDLKPESIKNGAEFVDPKDLNALQNTNILRKSLAIAVPTTSKGMKSLKERHVLLTALIPSLKSTLTARELKEFEIVLFIGFDKGDEYFERFHEDLRAEMYEILKGTGLKIIFLRLLPLRRVAMTWNMIFHLARRHGKFDYFYQVNDDLTMKTSGWLTKFTETLDKAGGIGVAGPSDSFNGFSCSLLTQSFVTWRHFDKFGGDYYPPVFRDWKSDRWLSFVYGSEGTFCWEEIEATNGAKETRYSACPFPEWKLYL